MVKNSPANAGDIRDAGLIPGSGRYPGGGHGNPLQYSCLENPMDRGAWQAAVHACLVSQPCLTLCDPMDCQRGSSVHGHFSGKNTGVGCHALLRGIFLTQGLNTGLMYCRWVLYQLRYQAMVHGVAKSQTRLKCLTYKHASHQQKKKNHTIISIDAEKTFDKI